MKQGFRARYDDLERRRAEAIARLAELGDKAHSHPGYSRARTLLNDKFRKASLVQRVAVLQAAEWLIDILQMWTMTL